MSEEEIIKICQNLWFDVDYFGIYYNKEENKDELAEQAIQGILDLYEKEKEKNKELEIINQMNRYRIDVIDERELISKDKINQFFQDRIMYRQFELQQEYKDFKDDIKLNVLQDIREELLEE